jgi:uncharacterized repeat protein (TIGR03803 family)
MIAPSLHGLAISGISQSWRRSRSRLPCVFMLAVAVVLTPSTRAQSLKVLYSFGVGDGVHPSAPLVQDTLGNLYGTASGGGGHGMGTVFRVSPTGSVVVLHSFGGYPNDGSAPIGGLILDGSGNFYGTTESGGTGLCGLRFRPSGCGTVFKIDSAHHETVLYSFPLYGVRGAEPQVALVRDSSGNLYGTTYIGGSSRTGVVFKLNNAGETVLHSFTFGSDGGYPQSSLVRDATGTLYGTASEGGTFNSGACAGTGCGVVFKMDAAGNETVLHSFTGGADGSLPRTGLVRDLSGNFYGTTVLGGNTSCNSGYGCGTIFKLSATGKKTVLHKFNRTDGAFPYGTLIRDASGNLYGTTSDGGTQGMGTVFMLSATGTETVLHSFSGADGALPTAGLTRDRQGNLYGTTFNGGAHGVGTVFKLIP